ncbi:hypothetical protein HYW41_01785 [Candidatus Daviesbacteria bacterium]|nr:hypothetical protein [Candidatus Daviesbacteria bacterium]
MLNLRKSKNWVYILGILLFSVIGTKALFHPGLFTAHDIWNQVVRFYYFSQAVNDNQFPPYWISQLAKGFGYPLFFFSYSLPWTIGILLLKFRIDVYNVIKILFFLSYLTSGIAMYFFVLNLLKERLAAFTSSILYLWLPYHFLIIFVGASMGIAFVFTFLPIIFCGIIQMGRNEKIGITLFSLGLSGVILSHIMHLLFLLPTILLFTLWTFINEYKKINIIKNISIGLFLTILISAFYLIPALNYNKSTKAHIESGFSELYKRNFVNFSQILYSKWGFGPIINNAKNSETSFQLGFAQWISIILLIIAIITKKISKNYLSLSLILLIIFVINIFLMLDYSEFIWRILIKYVPIDFPFRLLLPSAFITSTCAGVIIASSQKRLKIILSIFLILIAIYTNRNHININLYTNYPLSTYLDSELSLTTNTFNEYLPIQANTKLLDKPWKEVFGNYISSINTKQTTNSLSFDISLKETERVSIGQFYFPGQTLYLDKKISQYNVDKDGLISFIAPKGRHSVIVKYQETFLIKFSKFLTILGILITLLLFK